MPTISNEEPRAAISQPNYFTNLAELDEWTSKARHQSRLDGLIAYAPRSIIAGSVQESQRGNLLVCHDYKGGYTESPSSLAYTFNFWDRCEIFIYFSHQRVTIPPPGWVNAAHRQGVKILGVLIFEHKESMEDTLRLLLGKLPKSRTGPPASLTSPGFPISSYYARLLANLAYERGFDGYLLNFEFPFPGLSEQARALEAWISLLNAELKRTVGNHAQTIWYDSIITTGALRWQDRLNSRNISFFLASDAFFTNYTWPSVFPSFSVQYLLGLAKELLQGSSKTLRDIYVGIDVWGRGSHGGGGLGAFRAAEHIDPMGLGLSLALFGPAWSWESDEGSDGWSWKRWWERERTLWIGPALEGAHIEVPDAPLRQGEPPCPHGDFRPLSDFFQSAPPPNPDLLPFYTIFCPGVGHRWFVEGHRVLYKESGWTDIDKQTSLGNLLWPRPTIEWEGQDLDGPFPKAETELTFEDAFNGGSSVEMKITVHKDSPTFCCIWIPMQSIALTPGGLYEVVLVYKLASYSAEFDLALSAKGESEMEVEPLSSSELESGWSRVSITCKPSASPGSDVLANVGIILAVAREDESLPCSVDIQLGQLSVCPKSPLANITPHIMRLLWADCTRDVSSPSILLLTWDACVSFNSPATVTDADIIPEVPHPPWTLDRSPHWFPRLVYANIYAEKRGGESGVRPTASAMFVGTSGWGCGSVTGGGPNCFVLEKSCLPVALQEGTVRFYVQGVTDRGTVLPWECCVFVDFQW